MTDNTTVEEIMEISASAVDKIAELIASRGRGPLAVRVVLRGRLPNGGYQSEFKFVEEGEFSPETDRVQDVGPFRMYFDQSCAASIAGAKVDFDENKYSSGFNIDYPEQEGGPPQPQKEWTDPVAIAVQRVLDEQVNPGVAAHGGWVALLDVKKDTAYVEMGGGCQGCGLSDVTLKQGIVRLIVSEVPQIKAVRDITEHDEGNNPYYAPAEGGEREEQSASPLSE